MSSIVPVVAAVVPARLNQSAFGLYAAVAAGFGLGEPGARLYFAPEALARLRLPPDRPVLEAAQTAVEKLAGSLQEITAPIEDEVSKLSSKAIETLDQLEATLARIENTANPESPVFV